MALRWARKTGQEKGRPKFLTDELKRPKEVQRQLQSGGGIGGAQGA